MMRDIFANGKCSPAEIKDMPIREMIFWSDGLKYYKRIETNERIAEHNKIVGGK